MADRHDYVALEWVKGEIGETLKQARQALEAFVENPNDPSSMGQCLALVHQVHGTLQMVEFYGAALLAEEMEHLTQALQQGSVTNQGEALEVLMQAILQLPVYLDRVQSARRDLPLVVLPLLNDLRSARGETLLSETNLFNPPLHPAAPLDAAALAKIDKPDLPPLLRKMRQMLQAALVGLLRDQDPATNLGYLNKVYARLAVLCADAPLGSLWEICSALVEGMLSGSVANSPALRSLLKDSDKEFKRLIDQGVVAINQPASDELLKSLLFYVAKAEAQTPRISAVKERFSLDEALPDSALVDEERARLAGPDREAMRSVVAALCEELVRVKDNLDLFVRSDRQQAGELDALLVPLKQIADTLAVLGFGLPRKVILDQLSTVQSLALGQREPDDSVLMDVAGALLYVEATLAGMVGPAEGGRSEDSHLPTTDLTQIHQLVIRESRVGLQQAKDAIIEFIDSQWDHQHLDRVPPLLTQVRGGLAMIPLPRAAELLEGCNRYIQDQLLAERTAPKWHQLDTLADVLSGVEYYLERLAEDATGNGDVILDVAAQSLAELGWHDPRASVDEALEREAEEIPLLLVVAEAEPALEDQAPSLHVEPLPTPESDALDDPAVEDDAALAFDEEPREAFLDEPLGEALDTDESLPTLTEIITEPALTRAQVLASPVSELNPPAQNVPTSLLPPPADEEPIDDELREVFIEEAEEVLDTLDTYLPKWLADTANKSALTELRRAFHTLKGSGRMVRALVIGELSWAVENLLNRVLEQSVEASPAVQRVLRQARAQLPALIDEFAKAAQRQHDAVDELAGRAHALARGEAVDEASIDADAGHLADNGLPALSEDELALLSDFSSEPFIQPVAVPVEDLPAVAEPLDPQLLEIFRHEAETHLDNLQAFIRDCAEQLPQPVTDDLQRALHTLKGSAYMAGIVPMAELATPLERLVKEFKANLIPMDLLESELLQRAEKLFRVGLAQLETDPLAPIPGAPELIEQITQLQTDRLDAAQAARREGEGARRNPQLIANFLAAGMDILLDAEGLLRNWHEHPEQGNELTALLDELTTLGQSAQMAELPQVDELCEALLDVYGAVEEGGLTVDEAFFTEVENGHEALVSMMDQVAAGLEVSPQTARVDALRALLDKALDPRAIGLLKAGADGVLSLSELPDELAGLGALSELPLTHEQPDELHTELPDLPELSELSSVSDTSEPELSFELSELFDLSEATLNVEPEVPLPEFDADSVLDDFELDLPAPAPHVEESDDWLQAHDEPAFEPLPEISLELPVEPLIELPLETIEAAAAPIATPVPVASDIDAEIVEIFLEEAVDILESAGHALQRWLDDPENNSPLSSLQRDLHTLKGGARMAEIRPIGDLAHELETLYEGLVDRRYSYTPGLADLLLGSHDKLAQILEQLQRHQPLSDPAALIESIRGFRQGAGQPLASDSEIVPTRLDVLDIAPAEATLDGPVEFDLQALDFDTLDDSDAPALEAAEPVETETETETETGNEADIPTLELDAVIDTELPLDTDADPLEADLLAMEPDSSANDATDEVPTVDAPALRRDFVAPPLDIPAPPAPTPVVEEEERDPELLEIFLEEGFDIMDSSGAALQRWHADLNNGLEVETLLRDLHTLKGGARMVEVAPIGDLAHELEFLYEAFGAGSLLPTEEHFSLLQRSQDLLHEMLDALRGGQPIPSADGLISAIRGATGKLPHEVDAPSAVEPTLDDDADFETPPVADVDVHIEIGQPLPEIVDTDPEMLADVTEGVDELPLIDGAEQSVEGLAVEEPAVEELPVEEPLVEELTTDEVPVADLPVTEQPLLAATEGDEPLPVAPIVLPFVQRAAQAAANAAAQRPPQELVKVPAELLEGLVNLAGETSIFRGRVEQQVSDARTALGEMETTIERMRDQLRRLDTETQAQILSGHQLDTERQGYEEFDPLEMDRHSQLQQLSRALFESASDLLDLKETLAGRNRDAETLLLQQARVNTELQEGLMRTRMVPFERMLPRLRRIVRQVAGELGKQVEFSVGNADGEMDRSVLERIIPPLEHMLRNAVDHGLETAEVRRNAGKPETGTIRLTLAREGGDIVINLSDDGAGIALEAVRSKAIERGMMRADAQLSDQEILHFILEAGFSTANKVTQISGRGVGMDVVLSEVKQLGGSMNIDSTPGQGTQFQIRLPFTVSVNRALMVLSGEDLYAIPLNTIEGIVRVSPFELEAFYQDDALPYEYAGQEYQLRYLGELLSNGQQPKLIGQSLPLPVILVRSHDLSVAVQVDALAGSREIVVKGLGPQFSSVPGISGATILGDGRVVVILDLLAHLRGMQTRLLNVQQHHEDARQGLAEVEQVKPLLVMVVDDSVTVRKVTTRLLERAGMNVITAKDGVDAIALLQEHTPDILLLDIEMPRMDGFEVATLIRHDAQLKNLPIIMITSRTGQKHRERAMAIGVNDYLGKPYQESLLLDTIEQLAKQHV